MARTISAPAFLALLAACAPGGRGADTVRADYAVNSAAARAADTSAPATPVAGGTTAVPTPAPGVVPPASQPEPQPVPQPTDTMSATLTAVRAAHADGRDRVVFEFTGRLPRHAVRYEAAPARCGSGDPVAPVTGTALVVRFSGALAHRFDGERATVTVADRDRRPGLPTVKQLTQICDFEGEVEWLVGLTSRRRYEVTTMTAPFRVVVDVY